MQTVLYTLAAPPHEHALYTAPRPLPGRLIGRAAGMVHDIAPEYVELARRDDAQPITVITADGFESLVEAALAADGGYTRADYVDADAWDVEDIGRRFGLALLVVDPI